MVSNSVYEGFFYTANNDKNALSFAPSSPSALTPSGSGYLWEEPGGDNWYYVEHICGNFYYYEAGF